VTVFGTTSPYIPFDLLVNMDIWHWVKVEGTFGPDTGLDSFDTIVRTEVDTGFAHISGEVYYCV